ncbi:MAG TPA: hypothetical protein PLO16_02850 [Acidocella sp.]|nr:hypothetical protein [Acidocella sp.]
MSELALYAPCPTVPNPGNRTAGQSIFNAANSRDKARDNFGMPTLKTLAIRYFSRDKGGTEAVSSLPDNDHLNLNASVKTSQDQCHHDANEAAYEATERAAIIAVSQYDNPHASVPHNLPPAWNDVTITPTAGALCLSCAKTVWWLSTLKPTGWRCLGCYPPSPGQFQVVAT